MAAFLRRQAIVDPVDVEKVCRNQASREREKDFCRLRNVKALPNSRTVENVKFVVMGAARVGKTNLVNRFLYGDFNSAYKETVEDMHQGQCSAHNMQWILNILDTSGAYSFPAMRRLAIATGDIFFLVYSITDEESFEEVRRLREQILVQRAEKPVTIAVLGNKCDMPEKDRFLPLETLDCIVNIEWEHYHFETSAKKGINVDKAFKDVLQEIKLKREKSKSTIVSEVEEGDQKQPGCWGFLSLR